MTARPTARPRALALLAAAAAATLGLAGCAAGAETTASGERVDGGTITYAHQQEPACVFGGWIEQAYLSYQVLDSLVSLDEDHKVVPWLAEAWSVSDDGLQWTFKLKPGVKFTDGSDLTAEVVAYNFDHWVNNGGNSTALAWLGGYYESADGGRRPDPAGQPRKALPAPGRQPHAGLLRHPVAAGPRDPHRRGELRGADRLGCVHRRPLGPRAADRPEGATPTTRRRRPTPSTPARPTSTR